MSSIRKIALTPVKWASKKILHHSLLRFPGGDPHSPIACTYCPEMCRFSCPTAVASGNDAVTPCNKNSLLHREQRWPGRSAAGGPLWPIYDCTGCGRCTEFCLYGMPVADMLFEARSRFSWGRASEAVRGLSDTTDPVGDLAHELGDRALAERRLESYEKSAGAGGLVFSEPRQLFFARAMGRQGRISFDEILDAVIPERVRARLSARSWLLHESVWLSRRLGRASDVFSWVLKARSVGINLVEPFHHGMDCIDCGGEGAFSILFPEQARVMAREIWDRDSHRSDAILCFSARCAAHLSQALGGKIEVLSLMELYAGR